jgi:hypothetical protein
MKYTTAMPRISLPNTLIFHFCIHFVEICTIIEEH